MNRNIIHSVVLAALASIGASALAQADLPVAVGRISSVQGQVTVVGQDEPTAAMLNWPVTGGNHISTASGARTEFRIGSTAVRIDGDSDLEVTDLDDNLLRLRLNYGSVSIRVRSPELLRDFELSTPQARVTLLEPGLLRVDAGRVGDTSQISLLSGSARVDGAGSSVTVNAGRYIDVGAEDVRTGLARRDGFDGWAEARDRADDTGTATRFVSSGITGYEELDRNGSWTENVEYGTLWTPRNVADDWAPYRDGRWIWLAPWGWTWVDDAPWGYAPSHYGRWVMVGRRWSWAPGRAQGRPVWAPALVGWVGGEQSQLGFANRRGPGLGWFPLSPREHFQPAYRVSAEQQRRLEWTHNGKPMEYRQERMEHRAGVTVLPREQFEGHNMVQVHRGPQVNAAPSNLVSNAPAVVPPQPGPRRVLETNRNDGQDRGGRGGPANQAGYQQGTQPGTQPGRVLTAPSQPVAVQPRSPGQQAPGRSQQLTTLAPGQFGERDSAPQTVRPGDVRIDLRQRGAQGQGQGQTPGQAQAPGQAQGQAQPQTMTATPVLQVTPGTQDDRNGRQDRNRDDRRQQFRSETEQRGQQGQQPQQGQQAQQQQQVQQAQRAQQEQAQRAQQEQSQRAQQEQGQRAQQEQRQRAQQAQRAQQEQAQQARQAQQQAQPQARQVQQPQPQPQKEAEKHKDKDKDDRGDNRNQNR